MIQYYMFTFLTLFTLANNLLMMMHKNSYGFRSLSIALTYKETNVIINASEKYYSHCYPQRNAVSLLFDVE